jgi:hypothetical protein
MDARVRVTSVAGISCTITIGIILVRIKRLPTIVANISYTVTICVQLVRIVGCPTIILCIPDSVIITVSEGNALPLLAYLSQCCTVNGCNIGIIAHE